jgi:hypothetical protein
MNLSCEFLGVLRTDIFNIDVNLGFWFWFYHFYIEKQVFLDAGLDTCVLGIFNEGLGYYRRVALQQKF